MTEGRNIICNLRDFFLSTIVLFIVWKNAYQSEHSCVLSKAGNSNSCWAIYDENLCWLRKEFHFFSNSYWWMFEYWQIDKLATIYRFYQPWHYSASYATGKLNCSSWMGLNYVHFQMVLGKCHFRIKIERFERKYSMKS